MGVGLFLLPRLGFKSVLGVRKEATDQGKARFQLLFQKTEMASESKKPKIGVIDLFDSYGYIFNEDVCMEMGGGNVKWYRRELIPLLLPQLKEVEEYTIVGVGCGSGYSDLILLKELASVLKEEKLSTRIHYTVVEKEQKFVDFFKQNAAKKAVDFYPNITFEWHAKSREDFFDDLKDRRFHLVNFIHCLCSRQYYADIFPNIVKNHLYPSGVTFSVILPFDCFMVFTMTRILYRDQCGDGRGEEAEGEGDWGNQEGEGKEFDLNEFDKEHNCKSVEFINVVDVDVTEILQGTDKGLEKLSSLTGIANIKGNVDKTIFDELIGKIKEQISRREVIDGLERSYVQQDHHVCLIHKL